MDNILLIYVLDAYYNDGYFCVIGALFYIGFCYLVFHRQGISRKYSVKKISA